MIFTVAWILIIAFCAWVLSLLGVPIFLAFLMVFAMAFSEWQDHLHG